MQFNKSFFFVVKSVAEWTKPFFIRPLIFTYQRRCARSIKRLQRQNKNGKSPIRVAFLQMYITSNQDIPVFERMLADKNFDPYFIVYPDYYRAKSFSDDMYRRTKSFLEDKYGIERVLAGKCGDIYIDFTDKFDMMTTNNPYANMTPPQFRIEYWTKKGIPSFYISYFYMGRCYVTEWNLKMLSFSCFWRIFVENNYVIKIAKQCQVLKGRNCILTGCLKMDAYLDIVPVPRTRKRILVAPHHTIEPSEVSVGCFMEYADKFLDLVQSFPQVDFVFRPHPQLRQKLAGSQKLKGLIPWGEKKTNAYFDALRKEPNLIISEEGDYLQEFADSDALIHDSGSFLAEYLYTGKPCAYVYRNTINREKTFKELGEKCIAAHYVMYCHDDVKRFVQSVVLDGNDEKKVEREQFAKREIMVNYPHSSDVVLKHIKNALGMA